MSHVSLVLQWKWSRCWQRSPPVFGSELHLQCACPIHLSPPPQAGRARARSGDAHDSLIVGIARCRLPQVHALHHVCGHPSPDEVAGLDTPQSPRRPRWGRGIGCRGASSPHDGQLPPSLTYDALHFVIALPLWTGLATGMAFDGPLQFDGACLPIDSRKPLPD